MRGLLPNDYGTYGYDARSPGSAKKQQADHSAFYAWVDDTTTFYKMFGKVDWTIEETQEIPMSCYVAPATLT